MNDTTLNHPASAETHPDSLLSWIICLSAALFFFYEFVQMNMFNAITPELLRTFHVDAAQLGNLSACYFYGDVIFLIPAGLILDRCSTRKVILSAMCFCVAGTAMFANAHVFWVAGLARLMMGVGNAFSFLSCIRLASRWFTPKHMALVVGLIITIAMLGGAAAQTPLALLTQHFSWRSAVMMDAGFGFIIILLVMSVVRDYPTSHSKLREAELTTLQNWGLLKTLKMSLSNAQNWFAGLSTSFLNLSIFIMGALWGALYLRQVDHITRTHATNITTMIFIGTIIGAPIWGWLSDKYSRRKWPLVVGSILSFATIVAIMELPGLTYWPLWWLFLGLGLFTSCQILAYPIISESNPSVITSTALSISSVLIMGGGAVFQPLFGWMLDYHWSHLYRNNVPIYSTANFDFALLILPVTFALAVIGAILIKETYCKAQAS